MKSWKLSNRVWMLVGLSWLVGMGASSYLMIRLHTVSERYDRMFVEELGRQKAARILQVGFNKEVQEWKDVLLRGSNLQDLEKYADQLRDQQIRNKESAAALRQSLNDPAVLALLDRFVVAQDALSGDYAMAIRQFSAAGGSTSHEADAMVKGKDRAPTDLIDQIADLMSARTVNQAAEEAALITKLSLGLSLIFVFALADSVVIVRGIIRTLQRAVGETAATANQFALAASQIAASSQSLAQGSSEGAATVEQTSAAAKEIEALSQQNAGSSQSVAAVATRFEKDFHGACVSLERTVAAVEEIASSGHKMSKIIKVIDEIAF